MNTRCKKINVLNKENGNAIFGSVEYECTLYIVMLRQHKFEKNIKIGSFKLVLILWVLVIDFLKASPSLKP
jgi:hypothetical protein